MINIDTNKIICYIVRVYAKNDGSEVTNYIIDPNERYAFTVYGNMQSSDIYFLYYS